MKTILTVDDRLSNRRVLVAMLAHRGYRLIEAQSGPEALKIARKEKPDLIIADVLMPKMDGYEFVRRLRIDPKIAQTTVIFYTASYIEAESRRLAKACGVHHIIVKPAEPEEVLKIVDDALATHNHVAASPPAPEFAHEHLHLVTTKLAEKVHELEVLNKKLEDEIAERRRVAEELGCAHQRARRAIEDAERANRAKDHFLANLSHELRTPLTPVLMCASALEHERTIEPEFRQQLGMMRRNVELGARLIDDLLDVTKASHGKLQLLASGPVDVHSLLMHTEQIVRSDATAKSVNLEFALTAGEHHVVGDSGRLHQVFWNLLKNGIKFTPAGGRVTVRTTNPAPGKLLLAVEDTGAGIDEQTLPVIFRAFEQGNGQGPRTGGLGLGLAISKAIVELHGGTISAASAGVGCGSVFTIEFATVLAFSGSEVLDTASPQAESEMHPLRLLIVEDHEPTLAVIARLLRQRSHHVITANTVQGAVELAAHHTFDAVVTDLGLPDGNGIELMKQLTRDYGLRGIALSGYGMEHDRAETGEAGFLAHLVKPINFSQLEQVLRAIRPATPLSASHRDAVNGRSMMHSPALA